MPTSPPSTTYILNAWGLADDCILERAMHAKAVLDVGCGSGASLERAGFMTASRSPPHRASSS